MACRTASHRQAATKTGCSGLYWGEAGQSDCLAVSYCMAGTATLAGVATSKTYGSYAGFSPCRTRGTLVLSRQLTSLPVSLHVSGSRSFGDEMRDTLSRTLVVFVALLAFCLSAFAGGVSRRASNTSATATKSTSVNESPTVSRKLVRTRHSRRSRRRYYERFTT